MLNRLDDYPVHQTPEPLAHPATSDRNVYDRTWFNGYTVDGSRYFGFGMAIYPSRNVLDAAFSTVDADGKQHAFFASRRAPLERTEMSVGPIRLEIIEPMRRTRIVIEDNDSGLACDLEFTTRTAPIQEARQILWAGQRRAMDATRFDQFGRWTGTVQTPDGEFDVDEESWRGTKDRSWGIRGVGERPAGGVPQAPSAFFLWAPLIWDDHVTNAIFFDGPQGEPLVREGIEAPLHASAELTPEAVDAVDTRMLTAVHRIEWQAGTRWASGCELDLVSLDGSVRTIELEPMLRFQMKGLGYGHREWRQGSWQGELATGAETIDVNDLNPLQSDNLHVQQVVRATDDQGRTGIGVLEQICIGPYGPAGFTELLDGAKP